MGQPGRASKYRGPGKEDGAIPVGFLKGGGPESEAQECLRPRSGRSAREGGRGSGPSGRSTETVWPATGFVDTWFRAMMLNEVGDETTEVQPRVQARGGQAGTGSTGLKCPGSQGIGYRGERGESVGSGGQRGYTQGLS